MMNSTNAIIKIAQTVKDPKFLASLDEVWPAGGRGASVSSCADLTNHLQCSWVNPACAWKKH